MLLMIVLENCFELKKKACWFVPCLNCAEQTAKHITEVLLKANTCEVTLGLE